MDPIQTLINALVVGLVGLILARMTHNLRQEVKAEVAELRAELKDDVRRLEGGLAELRAELKAEIAEVRTEIRELRSDLTRVALAVGAEPRAGRQQA